jgi:hypothetical protein
MFHRIPLLGLLQVWLAMYDVEICQPKIFENIDFVGN